MDEKRPKINSAAIEKILNMYRNVCITENAFINDCNHYNDNYEQRRIAFEQVLELADLKDDALSQAWQIGKEIKRQRWHLALDEHGANKYVRLDNNESGMWGMKESEYFPGKRVGKLTLIRRTRISVYGNR